MHDQTYYKYYFKITIFLQNKTYLYKIKNLQKLNTKQNNFLKNNLSKKDFQNSWSR
jgi:hypothetical protein